MILFLLFSYLALLWACHWLGDPQRPVSLFFGGPLLPHGQWLRRRRSAPWVTLFVCGLLLGVWLTGRAVNSLEACEPLSTLAAAILLLLGILAVGASALRLAKSARADPGDSGEKFSGADYVGWMVGSADPDVLLGLEKDPRVAAAKKDISIPRICLVVGAGLLGRIRELAPRAWIMPWHRDLGRIILDQMQSLSDGHHIQTRDAINNKKLAAQNAALATQLDARCKDLSAANEKLNADLLRIRSRDRTQSGKDYSAMNEAELEAENRDLNEKIRRLHRALAAKREAAQGNLFGKPPTH